MRRAHLTLWCRVAGFARWQAAEVWRHHGRTEADCKALVEELWAFWRGNVPANFTGQCTAAGSRRDSLKHAWRCVLATRQPALHQLPMLAIMVLDIMGHMDEPASSWSPMSSTRFSGLGPSHALARPCQPAAQTCSTQRAVQAAAAAGPAAACCVATGAWAGAVCEARVGDTAGAEELGAGLGAMYPGGADGGGSDWRVRADASLRGLDGALDPTHHPWLEPAWMGGTAAAAFMDPSAGEHCFTGVQLGARTLPCGPSALGQAWRAVAQFQAPCSAAPPVASLATPAVPAPLLPRTASAPPTAAHPSAAVMRAPLLSSGCHPLATDTGLPLDCGRWSFGDAAPAVGQRPLAPLVLPLSTDPFSQDPYDISPNTAAAAAAAALAYHAQALANAAPG